MRIILRLRNVPPGSRRPAGRQRAPPAPTLRSPRVASARAIGRLGRDVAWAGRVGLRQRRGVPARRSEGSPQRVSRPVRPLSAARAPASAPSPTRVWTRHPRSRARPGLFSVRAAGRGRRGLACGRGFPGRAANLCGAEAGFSARSARGAAAAAEDAAASGARAGRPGPPRLSARRRDRPGAPGVGDARPLSRRRGEPGPDPSGGNAGSVLSDFGDSEEAPTWRTFLPGPTAPAVWTTDRCSERRRPSDPGWQLAVWRLVILGYLSSEHLHWLLLDRIINLVVGILTSLLILVTLISAFVFPQPPPKPLNIFFAVCISLSSITACILIYWYRQGDLEPKFRNLIYYILFSITMLCICANLYFHDVGK